LTFSGTLTEPLVAENVPSQAPATEAGMALTVSAEPDAADCASALDCDVAPGDADCERSGRGGWPGGDGGDESQPVEATIKKAAGQKLPNRNIGACWTQENEASIDVAALSEGEESNRRLRFIMIRTRKTSNLAKELRLSSLDISARSALIT
jgi:hypothetical protein